MYNPESVWNKRYSQNKETMLQGLTRCAQENLALTPDFIKDGEEEELTAAITSLQIIPSGRQISNLGFNNDRLTSCTIINYEGSMDEFLSRAEESIRAQRGFGTNYSTFTEHGLNPMEALSKVQEIGRKLAENNRRPLALMSLMDIEDPYIFEFIQCKTRDGDLYQTNISIALDDQQILQDLAAGDPRTTQIMGLIIQGMLLNGEPGIFNRRLANEGEPEPTRATPPCAELAMVNGEQCVFANINLTNTPNHQIPEITRLATRYLVRIAGTAGTRRMGLGICGLDNFLKRNGMDFRNFSDLPDTLTQIRTQIRNIADQYCDELNMPRLIKVTACPPSGTTAKLAGLFGGIEADSIEEAVSLSAEDHFRFTSCIQEFYADNGISKTVNINPENINEEELTDLILQYLPRLKGISVMPMFSRENMPYNPECSTGTCEL